jgi:hypothetical protein
MINKLRQKYLEFEEHRLYVSVRFTLAIHRVVTLNVKLIIILSVFRPKIMVIMIGHDITKSNSSFLPATSPSACNDVMCFTIFKPE